MTLFISKIKNSLISILSTVFVIIIFIGIIIFLYNLRRQGKTLQIIPEFKIIDMYKEDITLLNNSINIAKDILKKVKA
jgi:hypothetical protein